MSALDDTLLHDAYCPCYSSNDNDGECVCNYPFGEKPASVLPEGEETHTTYSDGQRDLIDKLRKKIEEL